MNCPSDSGKQSESGAVTSSRRIGRLGLAVVAHAMGTATVSLVLAYAPALQGELRLSPESFGFAVACFYGSQTLAALPAGWLVDRFGVRWSLITSHFLLAAGMLRIGTAMNWSSLAIGLACCGFGYVLINPATTRGVFVWFDKRRIATAMGTKQTGVPLGAVAAAAIAAMMTDAWRLFSVLLSASILLTSVLFLTLSREAAARPHSRMIRDLRHALTHRQLVLINTGGCLYNVAYGGILAYVVTYAYDEVGVSAAAASLLLAIIQVASAVSRIVWGIVADSLPGNGLVVGLLVCGGTGGAAVAVLPFASSVPYLIVSAVVLGSTLGGFAGLAQAHAVQSVDLRLVGAAVGFYSLMLTIGMMAGPMIFALFLRSWGYSVSFYLMALISLLGTLLFLPRASTAGLG